MPSPEFQRQLADPATRAQTTQLALLLQRELASYCGLMRLRLGAPGQPVEVLDLPGALSATAAAALWTRVGRRRRGGVSRGGGGGC